MPRSLSEFDSFNFGSAARPALESALVVICPEVLNAGEPHRRAAQRTARMCDFAGAVGGIGLLHSGPSFINERKIITARMQDRDVTPFSQRHHHASCRGRAKLGHRGAIVAIR